MYHGKSKILFKLINVLHIMYHICFLIQSKFMISLMKCTLHLRKTQLVNNRFKMYLEVGEIS